MAPHISDKVAMTTWSVLCVPFGVNAVASPREFQDAFCVKEQPRHDDMTRWFGFGFLTIAAAGLVNAQSKDRETRRNMMKLMIGCDVAAAGLHVYQAKRGKQEPKPAYSCAAMNGVTAGLMALKLATSKE